ncbi:MAG TPA: DUF2948 domain-containing protein [Rhodobacteraceae bacterium]|jgi:hypothetical protein|nr:DUF2948 domain-containing protein [Paracoccaceae bacterium]
MAEDAKFEDGAEKPLQLKAEDADDLAILAALVQDAVFPAGEISWQKSQHRFAILLNRFRWEDSDNAQMRKRPFERVQSVLLINDVVNVQSQGVDRADNDLIMSLLSISFSAGKDGTGRVILTLAGDGVIGLDVECLDLVLKDVTRPYIAPSKAMPKHPE